MQPNQEEHAKQATLLVLAAGMGSRYGGIKQIDAVGPGGEALIDYSIYDALAAGFDAICFVVREEIAEDVRQFYHGKFPGHVSVTFVNQSLADVPEGFIVPADRSKPWGTGHAVLAARDAVDTPFAVINGDDFYGRESFELMFDFLSTQSNSSTEYCMVGYRLRETLSEHGSVSRGICQMREDGYLEGIEEHKQIEKTEDGALSHRPAGSDVRLTGEEIASMNFFGFTPAIFGQLWRQFGVFLKDHATDAKAEFFIPWGIDNLLTAHEASMKVLPTSSTWFGMTYREEKEMVQQAIRQFINQGVYPERLWS
jgi:UTP-glucose-1-phosphate uridylyltransferase